MRYIVTSGSHHTDIDIFACCITYAEFLRLKGLDAVAVLRAPFTQTVTSRLKELSVSYSKEYTPQKGDKFVIQDASDPKYIEKFVNEEDIVTLYDHHFGFENYWKGKVSNLIIEEMGACATFLVEDIEKEGLLSRMSQESKLLLYTSIFANSLNFNAHVTKPRDHKAFEILKKHLSVSENYQEEYFRELQSAIINDLKSSLVKDTKYTELIGSEFAVAQIELWDAREQIDKLKLIYEEYHNSEGKAKSMILVPSICDGKTYIISNDSTLNEIKSYLSDYEIVDGVLIINDLFLRKEIFRMLLPK